MVFKLDSRQCNQSASNANVFVSFSQAKVNIIAGCCMAMGLRFAGSANLQAFNCLVSLFALLYFLSYKYQCVHLYFTKQNVPKNGSMNRSEHCNGKIMFSACEKLNNCSHACRNLTTLYCMLVWCSSVSFLNTLTQLTCSCTLPPTKEKWREGVSFVGGRVRLHVG